MRVLVIGAGPAGLIAANELSRLSVGEFDIDIITDTVKPSVIGGAQFLHEPIPNASAPEDIVEIRFCKYGESREYARKIYGERPILTSWDGYVEEVVTGYRLGAAYERLWKSWKGQIRFGKVDRALLAELMGLSGDDRIPAVNQTFGPDKIASYDLIVDTAPMHLHCQRIGQQWVGQGPVHEFNDVKIFLVHTSSPRKEGPNSVVYNGIAGDSWYRYSQIEGESWFELGENADMSDVTLRNLGADEVVKGIKPLAHTCTCFDRQVENGQLLRVGRFGSWKRGYLLHHVRNDVKNYFAEFVL